MHLSCSVRQAGAVDRPGVQIPAPRIGSFPTGDGGIFGIQSRQMRNIEKQEQIENPYNTFIRHMYLESIDPTSSLIPLIERLMSLDVEWHQDLSLKSDDTGWKMESFKAARTAQD